MREDYRKKSRKYGDMVLRSYAPGDGSIDFNWVSFQDQNGAVLDEPVTESDVTEWLELDGNRERFSKWVILELGKGPKGAVPYSVRIAEIVQRPFHTSTKLEMDGVVYEYKYHGRTDQEHFHYYSSNTDFYISTGSRSCKKVGNSGEILRLCFFLNNESDFERNGFNRSVA